LIALSRFFFAAINEQRDYTQAETLRDIYKLILTFVIVFSLLLSYKM